MFNQINKNLLQFLFILGSLVAVQSFSINPKHALNMVQSRMLLNPSNLIIKHYASSDDSNDESRYEYARITRGVKRDLFAEQSEDKKIDDDSFELDDLSDEEDEEDDDDDDDFDGIIPNNLLDQIDPDGVVDRIPELLSDPKFWRDAVIVLILASYAAVDPSSPLRFINADDIDYSKFYTNV